LSLCFPAPLVKNTNLGIIIIDWLPQSIFTVYNELKKIVCLVKQISK